MKVYKIYLDDKVRFLRVGFGKHENDWFFRIDLWSFAYRFTW